MTEGLFSNLDSDYLQCFRELCPDKIEYLNVLSVNSYETLINRAVKQGVKLSHSTVANADCLILVTR